MSASHILVLSRKLTMNKLYTTHASTLEIFQSIYNAHFLQQRREFFLPTLHLPCISDCSWKCFVSRMVLLNISEKLDENASLKN